VDGRHVIVQAERADGQWRVTHGGASARVRVLRRHAAELLARMPVKAPTDLSRFLLSPMPGLVVAIQVAEGDTVKAGQPLATIDAMKMENVLRAERDGRVAKVRVTPGASVAVDQVILEFADEGGPAAAAAQ